MTKHNTFWGLMYSLVWVVLAFVAGVAMNGCASPSATVHPNIVKNVKPWTLPTRCKLMDKAVTPNFIIAVQQGCLSKNITSVVIIFRVPYKKGMDELVAQEVSKMLGPVTLDPVTMGSAKGRSFFLMVVRQ